MIPEYPHLEELQATSWLRPVDHHLSPSNSFILQPLSAVYIDVWVSTAIIPTSFSKCPFPMSKRCTFDVRMMVHSISIMYPTRRKLLAKMRHDLPKGLSRSSSYWALIWALSTWVCSKISSRFVYLHRYANANVYNMKNLCCHESQFEPCYAKVTSFPPKSQFHPQTTKTTHQGTFNFHIVQLSSLSITCYGIHDLHFGANGSSHLGTIYHGTTSCVGQLQSICGLAVSCHRNHTVLPTKKEKVPTSSRNSAQEFSHTHLGHLLFQIAEKKCFLDQKTHLEKLITFAPAVVTNPCHDWTIRGDSIRGIRSHGLLEFVVGHCLNLPVVHEFHVPTLLLEVEVLGSL